jgi:hypothetical protein
MAILIPDSAKLSRYEDLSKLVEELHDENMQMRKLLRLIYSTSSPGTFRSEISNAIKKSVNTKRKK